ncbi:MarR family winged helix-turn-helix transcriptional regulator [Georgenia sp. SYP-B2076]|uniref:MarR family winged helix-turn-helix transcriptional regulator n=1 Tax=Georgenia sp. SYP-B2076 TaxID=2495881 RepID=UPI000F8D2FE3|nr:MarR family transcriptional regulator [Georgenia sp. SYP-B2076]
MPEAPYDEELFALADQFRTVVRDAVFVMRTLDVESGVTSAQLSTLNMVAAGPLRVNVIARRLGIRVPSATEQIIRLERAGLVRRSPDPTDARAVLVRLTPAGEEHRRRENRRRSEVVAAELRRLPDQDRRAVAVAIETLDRFSASLAENLTARSAGATGTRTTGAPVTGNADE